VRHKPESRLEDEVLGLTTANVLEIDALCQEFGFEELGAKASEFLLQNTSAHDYYRRILVLLSAHSVEITALKSRLSSCGLWNLGEQFAFDASDMQHGEEFG
jgi:hypothetical protein